MTDNPYQAFKCVKKGERRQGLSQVTGPTGFKARPRCPHGSHPVMTPDSLQAYRCVMSSGTEADPALTPQVDEEGRTKAWTVPPAGAPSEGAEAAPAPGPLTGKSFARYSIPGEMTFDFPKAWHVTDAWKDTPPTIYVVYDAGRSGKQVTLTVTLSEPDQPGYQSMKLAIQKEKEWQGAAPEKGQPTVGGLPAQFVSVKGTSRSAYLDSGEGRYFTLNYSAPADLYDRYLPAFDRMLKSFRPASQ
jgi:hypothetical protein